MKLKRAFYSLLRLGRQKFRLVPIKGPTRVEGPKAGIEGRQKEACLYPVPAFLSKYLMIP